MQGDRRTENRVVEKATLIGIVVTLFFQVGACVWWASKTNTILEYQSVWIAEHRVESKMIPVLEKRVCVLEDSLSKLVVKLDKIIDGYHLTGDTSKH